MSHDQRLGINSSKLKGTLFKIRFPHDEINFEGILCLYVRTDGM